MGPVPENLAGAPCPPAVRHVLEALAAHGRRSWLVGGAVRDLLLHRPRAAADFDVATPATPGEVQRLFPRTIPTGVEHGTVTVVVGGEHVEVTTFRGEGAYVDGRRPSSVTFLDDVDGDLARRDFTMNAIAWDPLAGELRDPFGGRADLARRLIRAVGDPNARFGEDGLRPLRAVRFAAQLGFALDPATRDAIPGSLPVTRRVAAERMSDELAKLLCARRVGAALQLLEGTGLLAVVLPPLAARPDRDHALRTAARTRPDLVVRLAALLHELSPAVVRGALEQLRFAGAVVEEASTLVRLHACSLATPPPVPRGPAEARRWLAAASSRRAPALLALWRADARSLAWDAGPRRDAREAAIGLRRALAEQPPLTAAELAIDGGDVMALLGVAPGPNVGAALRYLVDVVLEDPSKNERRALEDALRAWWTPPGPGVR